MGVLDFLFQGSTPSTTNSSSGTAVPAWLQQYTAGILSEGANVASQPYQPYQGPRVAGATADQNSAYDQVRNTVGQYHGPIAQATALANSSANPSAIGGALGQLPTAQSYIDSSVAPSAAQINPYVGNVINQAQNQAQRTWNNTIMPTINNQFTAAGQFGSSANQRAAAQAGQQVTQQIQDTSNAQYADAFKNAQQANLAAGQATGNLAQTQGGLGYEQGALGLQGANQLGSLASLGQNLGISGAGALDTIGLEQQNQNQQNLNTAYGDFQNQQQYPYQQLGWLSQLLNGQTNGIPGGSTSSSVTNNPGSGTSPLMGAIGAYTAGQG
jgi:hypothetical protein